MKNSKKKKKFRAADTKIIPNSKHDTLEFLIFERELLMVSRSYASRLAEK